MPDNITPIERLLDAVPWNRLPDPTEAEAASGLPYATHQGVLWIGDAGLIVYRLSDGQRIVAAESLAQLLNFDPTAEGGPDA